MTFLNEKARLLRLLLDDGGFLPFAEIIDALAAQSGAGAIQALLSELCAAGIIERRGVGHGPRKRYAYRVINIDAATEYVATQGIQQSTQSTRLRHVARVLRSERERVDEWFATMTWDAPARAAFMAYYRGELPFTDLARVLRNEGFPLARARRSAR